jgi:hypothetical protein
MQTTNFTQQHENTFKPSMDGITQSNEPVVVFYPSGNYNQLTELGRYKNLAVAMAILTTVNLPKSSSGVPEYRIFSLESGLEIQVH